MISEGSQAGLSNLCSLSVLNRPGHHPQVMVVLMWKEMKRERMHYLHGKKGWTQWARGTSVTRWGGGRARSAITESPLLSDSGQGLVAG